MPPEPRLITQSKGFFKMTKRFLKVMLLLGGLLAFAVAMNAQSEVVTVHVPFTFVVSGKSLPAGDYRVDKGEASSVLVINGGSGNSAAFITMAAEPSARIDGASLTFERRGSTLYLSTIRLGGDQVRVLIGPDAQPGHAAIKSTALASPTLH
jgi:hypothetical protein